jgi:hypothetical protein
VTEAPWRHARQAHEQAVGLWRSPFGAASARIVATARRMALVNVNLPPDELLEAIGSVPPGPISDADAITMALECWEAVRDAPTWSVSGDMAQLLQVAGDSMPDETIEAADLPGPAGFVYLEEPIWKAVDDGSAHVALRGWHWRLRHNTVDVVTYGRREDVDRDKNGDPLSDITEEDRRTLPPLYSRSGFAWPLGFDAPTVGVGWESSYIKALWTLAKQTIATTSTPALPRAEKRRGERLNMPAEVVVVTLRRAKRPTSEDTPVETPDWTHRWVVAGHWRNQYLPSTGTHRLQWIAEHIKGPDDKPLVIKPHVFDVRR